MQVYLITNKTTGKCYVGKTTSVNLHGYLSVKRWQVKHNHVFGMPIINAIRKHGWGAFDVRTVALCDTEEELNNLERLWILLLNTTNCALGYNICGGGEGGTGHKLSDATKRKIGLANKGRKPVGYVRTEKHRQQLKKRMMGNHIGVYAVLGQWLKNMPAEYRIAKARKAALARWGRVAVC